MLVAAELTLAGIPALKVPDNWPGYDVIAQPKDMPPQRISVKGRTFRKGSHFVDYFEPTENFDWLAIVLVPGADLNERRVYIVARADFDAKSVAWLDKRTGRIQHYIAISRVEERLGRFRNNFQLRRGADFVGTECEQATTGSALP